MADSFHPDRCTKSTIGMQDRHQMDINRGSEMRNIRDDDPTPKKRFEHVKWLLKEINVVGIGQKFETEARCGSDWNLRDHLKGCCCQCDVDSN